MPPAAAHDERNVGTLFPYWRDVAFGTLLPIQQPRYPGASMFIFPRSPAAPLLALAAAALLVVIDHVVDLSALL